MMPWNSQVSNLELLDFLRHFSQMLLLSLQDLMIGQDRFVDELRTGDIHLSRSSLVVSSAQMFSPLKIEALIDLMNLLIQIHKLCFHTRELPLTHWI